MKRGCVWSFVLQLLSVFTWCLTVSHSPPSPLLTFCHSFAFSPLCFSLFLARCKVWRRWTAIRSRSLLRGRWQRCPARRPQSRRHPWTRTKPPYIGRTNSSSWPSDWPQTKPSLGNIIWCLWGPPPALIEMFVAFYVLFALPTHSWVRANKTSHTVLFIIIFIITWTQCVVCGPVFIRDEEKYDQLI